MSSCTNGASLLLAATGTIVEVASLGARFPAFVGTGPSIGAALTRVDAAMPTLGGAILSALQWLTRLGESGPSLLQHETSLVSRETSFVHHETSFVHHETSLVYRETSLVYRETGLVYPETRLVYRETSLVCRETSLV